MSSVDKKKKIAQKMIQHTHFDRATGKLVRTMVPQSKEHKERSDKINKHMKSLKEPSNKEKSEYQRRIGRAYND